MNNDNPKKFQELTALKAKADFILSFMYECTEISNYSFQELSRALNGCIKDPKLSLSRKLASMKMAVGDLEEWASDLNHEQKRELNKRLREEFGSDLCTIDKRIAKRMESVLKRGKIRNDDEYTRVSEWIDHLLWNPDKQDQQSDIATFERLLGEYVEKKSIKSNKH